MARESAPMMITYDAALIQTHNLCQNLSTLSTYTTKHFKAQHKTYGSYSKKTDQDKCLKNKQFQEDCKGVSKNFGPLSKDLRRTVQGNLAQKV